MTDLNLRRLNFLADDFGLLSHDHQFPPDGDWTTWLLLGGRGAGKTRMGAEWVRGLAMGITPFAEKPVSPIALVGETEHDAREVMIEGVSGLMAVHRNAERPAWISSRRRLEWQNGAVAQIFSAEDPDSLRGPQFAAAWADDLIQRRFIEAILATFDPAFGADDDSNPPSTLYDGRMIDPAGIYLWTWDARPYPVFPTAIDVWSDGPNWETGHWLTGRLGSTPLAGLVSAMIADADAGEVATDALGEGPDGYVIDRPMAPRAALEPLAQAYAFDACANGDALQFRPRGGDVIVDLTEDDLVSPDRGMPARITRAQETELPREVSLGFTDGFADYRRSAATSRRLVGGSARVSHADLAAVIDPIEAERRAEIWLQDLWAGRERAEFSLPPSKVALTPGDVVGLTVNGRRRVMELREFVDTESRKVSARSIDPEIFGQALAPPQRRASSVPAALGPVHAVVLDLPTVDGSDPPVLLRAAVFADPWPGPVTIWKSLDGTSYERAALATAPSIIGVTLDELASGVTGRFDRGADLRVELLGGVLTSVSDSALLAGANAAALKHSDGAWEIVQFANAEIVAERTYRLTKLLRGQMGSEWAMAAPLPAGAVFVMLDQHVSPVVRGQDALLRPLYLRFVAAGRSHGDSIAVGVQATPQATALRPLEPVHLAARRNGADIVLSFVRRTRFAGDGWEAEVPLGEDGETYEIDILDGTTVVRTLQTAQPAAIYAAADELADFGAPQASISVRVTQLSATVGRGFAAQSILTL